MDLGITGRKAIVCASSKGLGRACAMALAQAGCDVVVNGREPRTTSRGPRRTFGERTGVTVLEVAGRSQRSGDARGADRGLPGGRHPRQQQRRAAVQGLRRDHAARTFCKGVESNMLTPIALVQALLPGMAERKFGRIINITSGSVRAPIAGLDVSSGARAGLTAFLAAAARAHVRDNVTINSIQPGAFATDRISARRSSATRRSAASRSRRPGRRPRRVVPPAVSAIRPSSARCARFSPARKAGFITGQNILIDGGAFPGAF